MSENIAKLSGRQGLKENLFESLVQAKGDPMSLKALAKSYKVGEATVYGASSAYDFIQGDNANKSAYVCNGSSCLCANTQENVKQQLLKHYSADEIGHVTCLGRCHENSAFQLAGNNYSGDDISQLPSIIASEQNPVASVEKYHVECALIKPILTEEIIDVAAYYQLFTQLIKSNDKPAILEEIIQSNLRGRGGAGFPTGIKWQSCAQQIGSEKYVVCNADEGDPGAFSDRYLMEHRPHALLFGMLVAGYIADAQWGVIYIRDEYPQSVEITQQAIEDFNALDILANIEFNFQFKIVRGAGAYICGEETALLRSIEGQRPMVSVRPPFPTVKGLFGKPTILNNVETFASVHWILENSGAKFAAIGNGRSTGSKLISMDSCFQSPGIYEVAMGTPLSEVIRMAGGFSRPTKALHIGGPLGGLVPIEKINVLTIDFESFQTHGFLLGHASIIGIPETQNMAQYIHHLFEFTAAESCGKCFPCRLGATRGKEMFRDALKSEIQLDKNLLDDLLETMQKGSLCALGGGVPLPVQNALQYFMQEMEYLFEPQSLNRIPVVEKS